MASLRVVSVLDGDQVDPLASRKIEGLELVVVRTAGDLGEALTGAHVVVLWEFLGKWLRRHWSRAGDLEWVHVAGAGVDNVLFPEFVHSDVVLTNARGVFDAAIAEYVLGLALVHSKDLRRTLDNQRSRRWEPRLTTSLAGAQMLVVGPGSVGRSIARLARAVGMSVVAVGRSHRPADPDFARIERMDSLRDQLAVADFVVLTVPLTAQTRLLFDRDAFAAMRPTAYLINVSRGAVVDSPALLEALEAGAIAGAALDVFTEEPLPPADPLWSAPNVVISPHMSAAVPGIPEAMADLFLDNLDRWRSGRPLRNVVDEALGFVTSGEDIAPP